MTAARAKKGKEAAAMIGIIGGSGLYSMAGLKDTREIRVKTPFGHAGREARGVSRAARAWAPNSAE
jgi:purine nucleoside phosphorylase